MKKVKINVFHLVCILCAISFGIFLSPNQNSLQAATNQEVSEVIDGIEWLATTDDNGVVEAKPSSTSQIGEEVTIPEYIGDLQVTGISASAFYGCTTLTTVHMSDSIISIGNSAFKGCSKLNSIDLSQNLVTIGISAFVSCNFSGISIPEGVTEIARYTFHKCYNLENVFLPSSIEKIGKCAFMNCPILSITVPRNTTEVEQDAFAGCDLEYISVDPYNVTYSSINGVLYNIEQTELIQCPMGYQNTCTISEGVTSIGGDAFLNCTKLTEIIFPDSLMYIGEDAFIGCTGLTSLAIGKNITEFKNSMIEGCTNIQEFQVSEENETFCCCDGILYDKKNNVAVACPKPYAGEVNIPSWVEEIEDRVFSNCPLITEIHIPESVTSIGYNFENCYSLSEVTIGKGVNSISDTEFVDCYSLERIDVDSENQAYCSVDGILFSKDMKQLFRCPEKFAGSYSIPVGVEVLEDGCFTNCFLLSTLVIPEGVKEANEEAFSGYTCINELYMPKSLVKADFRTLFMSPRRYTITVTDGEPNIAYDSDYMIDTVNTTVYYGGTKEDFSNIEIDGFSKYYGIRPDVVYYLEPAIVTQPISATYNTGDVVEDTLIVWATPGVDDTDYEIGELSYQWYVSSEEDMSESVLIEGATEQSYLPPTTEAKTLYYSCVVTNTVNEYSASITSEPAKIEVLESQVQPVQDDLTVVSKLSSEWETGFNGELVITNNSNETIHSWKVSFQLADKIENLWCGILTEEDNNTYVIENESYNGTILLGQSITVGYTVTKSGSTANMPTDLIITSEN